MQFPPLFSSLHITRASSRKLTIEYKADNSQRIIINGKIVGQGQYLEKGSTYITQPAKIEKIKKENTGFSDIDVIKFELFTHSGDQLSSLKLFHGVNIKKSLKNFLKSVLAYANREDFTITSPISTIEAGNVTLEVNRSSQKPTPSDAEILGLFSDS